MIEVDSRFRGNDVSRARYATLTTTVIPAIAVFPAKAGIHVPGNSVSRGNDVSRGGTGIPPASEPGSGSASAWRRRAADSSQRR